MCKGNGPDCGIVICSSTLPKQNVYKLVSFSPLPEGVVRGFFAQPIAKYGIELDVKVINELNVPLIQKELSDADYIIGDYSFKIPITAEMIAFTTKVKLIQQPSTGYEHIDIKACREKGIPVANIGGTNAISVAEHTIALALILQKRIISGHQKLLQGTWAQGELMNLAGELHGKTWGIIGLGRIGRAVASRVKSLGANVIYYDSNPPSSEEGAKLGVSSRTLAKLLSESDVVSIHTPLTKETVKMIGERELRFMKPGSIFINTSRGELADEAILAKAASEGWISGVGVDVFRVEPPPSDHPLILAAKQGAPIVLTPHIAGATNDSRMRIIQFTIENLVRVMLGAKPENVVNDL
ncbi:MAG: 2-hydroxyacid dehydrogenase [Nitrososphaerales archaeon]